MSTGELTQGRRMYLQEGQFMPCEQPGDYGKGENNEWWAWAPCEGASPAKITKHEVTEHDDGTITASPSILMNFGRKGVTWHGYLERGIWREC